MAIVINFLRWKTMIKTSWCRGSLFFLTSWGHLPDQIENRDLFVGWIIQLWGDLSLSWYIYSPGFSIRYTLWLFNIAMGNGPFIEAYPLKNGDFPWQTVSHNQMVSPFSGQVIHPLFWFVIQAAWGNWCNSSGPFQWLGSSIASWGFHG